MLRYWKYAELDVAGSVDLAVTTSCCWRSPGAGRPLRAHQPMFELFSSDQIGYEWIDPPHRFPKQHKIVNHGILYIQEAKASDEGAAQEENPGRKGFASCSSGKQ
jgi:hypothetical protein